MFRWIYKKIKSHWKNRSLRFCVVFFSTVCSIFAIIVIYVFILDPWQLFHQTWFRESIFIKNGRFQNAGIINNYEFDSVIIGYSMAENFSAQEASMLLGGKFVNLSFPIALLSERNIILKRLLQKKDNSKVIISLEHLPTVSVGTYNIDISPDKYDFLYNWNPFDDLRIYFDVNLFNCWNYREKCQKEIPGERRNSLQELSSWYHYYEHIFGGTQAWCNMSKSSTVYKTLLQSIVNYQEQINNGAAASWSKEFKEKCIENSNSTFDTYILTLIKKNPDVEFLLFIPPYSRLWSGQHEQSNSGYYQTYLSFISHIVKVTNHHSNVLFFGFDNMDFTADVANYMDTTHYHEDINSRMLKLMSEQSNILTAENVDDYLGEIQELAHRYDLQSIANKFKTCLDMI